MTFQALMDEHGSIEHFKKRAHVFSQGAKSNSIYLVKQGALKAYYLDLDGKEYVKSLLFTGNTIASVKALQGDVCSFSLICLEDTSLYKLSYDKVKDIALSNLSVANSVIDLLMQFGIKKERREFELLTLSAEQRYQQLLASTPDIHQRVTQNDMARYLGITPVALSRIKHKPSIT